MLAPQGEQRMSRRKFAKSVTAGVAGIAVGGILPSNISPGIPTPAHPNIIFLMTDQQRWDCIGALNPHIKTPNLDKLVRQGIVMRQAVCQAPMCVPSRYAMMLGVYPSQSGVYTNADSVPDDRLPAMPLPEITTTSKSQVAW